MDMFRFYPTPTAGANSSPELVVVAQSAAIPTAPKIQFAWVTIGVRRRLRKLGSTVRTARWCPYIPETLQLSQCIMGAHRNLIYFAAGRICQLHVFFLFLEKGRSIVLFGLHGVGVVETIVQIIQKCYRNAIGLVQIVLFYILS